MLATNESKLLDTGNCKVPAQEWVSFFFHCISIKVDSKVATAAVKGLNCTLIWVQENQRPRAHSNFHQNPSKHFDPFDGPKQWVPQAFDCCEQCEALAALPNKRIKISNFDIGRHFGGSLDKTSHFWPYTVTGYTPTLPIYQFHFYVEDQAVIIVDYWI